MMAKITIEPSGVTIEVEPGQTILEAALKAELAWTHTCGGQAKCTTCAYTLLKGSENVSPKSRLEEHQLVARKGRALAAKMRLACQTKVQGDITVQKNIMII
jgi:ferredoxin, 2Fe-2S